MYKFESRNGHAHRERNGIKTELYCVRLSGHKSKENVRRMGQHLVTFVYGDDKGLVAVGEGEHNVF